MTEAHALLRLQELDLEYSRLKHNAETLPHKDKIQSIRLQSKQIASELTKIVGQRKDLEIEINDLAVHKSYLTAKVTEVQNSDNSNYRASQDLENSLSSLAKKIEKVDFQTNALVEKLEKAERAEKNARELLEKAKNAEQDETLAYKLALEAIAKQVSAIASERAGVVKQLSEDTLATYEAARKRFGGIAVETLVGNKPTACRVALQPSSYSDLKRASSSIVTCPYCKRMLVLSDEE